MLTLKIIMNHHFAPTIIFGSGIHIWECRSLGLESIVREQDHGFGHEVRQIGMDGI